MNAEMRIIRCALLMFTLGILAPTPGAGGIGPSPSFVGTFVGAAILAVPPPDSAAVAAPIDVPIFRDAAIEFRPDSTAGKDAPDPMQSGRVIAANVHLPEIAGPHRIRALLTIKPIPKTEREVFDRWDRAGSIRVVTPGGEVEVVRFITSYGGRTEHEVDVTELAPILRGERQFRAFIDTWVSPAWRVDLTLRYQPVKEYDNSTWAAPVFLTDSFNSQDMPGGREVVVEVPKGLARVVLRYVSTGHCTDGTDADEFISKANVISVDGVVVARYHPWRDDCRRYRERNPYTSHWTDGSWSSDYSRSGWCPGVEVSPMEIDLSDHLTPGKHRIRFVVEGMRPKDGNGNFGYWRLSACAIGWDKAPALWRNE
jgi:hypothetical protein